MCVFAAIGITGDDDYFEDGRSAPGAELVHVRKLDDRRLRVTRPRRRPATPSRRPVRAKVLVDGAELLARATTYAFATFGVQAAGASAGINAKPEVAGDAAVAAFVEGRPAPPARSTSSPAPAAAGAVPLGSIRRICAWAPSPRRRAFLGAAGAADRGRRRRLARPARRPGRARWAAIAGGVDADAGCCSSPARPGSSTTRPAAAVKAKLIVPLTPVPVDGQGVRHLSRAGTRCVPDAVSCAAPLLAVADPDGGDPIERVGGGRRRARRPGRRGVAGNGRAGRDVPGDLAGAAALRPPLAWRQVSSFVRNRSRTWSRVSRVGVPGSSTRCSVTTECGFFMAAFGLACSSSSSTATNPSPSSSLQELEPLLRHELVALEPQAEHLQSPRRASAA